MIGEILTFLGHLGKGIFLGFMALPFILALMAIVFGDFTWYIKDIKKSRWLFRIVYYYYPATVVFVAAVSIVFYALAWLGSLI